MLETVNSLFNLTVYLNIEHILSLTFTKKISTPILALKPQFLNICEKFLILGIQMKRFLIAMLGVIMCTTVSCQKSYKNIKKTESQLRVNIAGEPATLDPRKGGDLVSSSMHFMLFEGLTRINPDGSTAPAQASSIEISKDRKTYTFHLRDSKWSDGNPVTAYDFEKSWKDVLDPTFPSVNAHLFYPIKNAEAAKKGQLSLQEIGITAKDAKTLVVELENPTPYFLELTAFCVFFPVNHHIDRKFPDWAYHADARFVCNGPFKITGWKHNHEIVFEKNKEYWEADKIKLDAIHISMIENEMTALHMYENGMLDMLGMPLSSLPADALQDLTRKKLLNTRPVAGTTICVFNTQKFPFNNVNMRKAFSLAMNRTAIVKNITQLNEQIAVGAIPPVLKNNKTVAFYQDHDVAEARACFQKGLEELGIQASDLGELIYAYTASELHQKIAQALQYQWFEVLDVKVKIEALEHKVLLDRLSKRDITFAQTIWLAQYSDQMNILERYKSPLNVKNYAAWENETYKQLIEASAFAATPDKRLELLEKAETVFLSEMPVAPIYHSTFAFLIKPYLKNVHLSLIGDIYFDKIVIDEEEKAAR